MKDGRRYGALDSRRADARGTRLGMIADFGITVFCLRNFVTRAHLKLPDSTHFWLGAYVGRFSSAVILALIPNYPVLVVEEIPNYHYVGDGEIELAGLTTVEWGELVVRTWRDFAGKDSKCSAWVDPDTEFTKEMQRCKLRLKRNLHHGPELRVEVTREYFHDNKIFLAPWLTVLPNEISRARWPPEESSAYKIRAEGQDYTLSALEQVISRRPLAKPIIVKATPHWIEQRIQANGGRQTDDTHLGSL